METLLLVSIAILAGLLMTRLSRLANLPTVTAYLVSGVLIGPFGLGALGVGFTTTGVAEGLDLASEIALGFIAFSIGSEFRVKDLKAIGRQTFVVGVLQALTATLFVDAALFAFHLIRPDILSAAQVLTLGAIATATAPAATLMVVRQYKAKGPLTSLLLPVVALDDAVGLVVFAVSFGLAKTLALGSTDMVSILVDPLVEIVASLGLGALMGWLLTELERLFNSNTNRLNMTIAFVFLTVALSMAEFHVGPVTVGFSSLLVCMMLGTVFCNLCPLSHDLMNLADKWSSPVLALFFVLCGAELDLGVFASGALVLVRGVHLRPVRGQVSGRPVLRPDHPLLPGDPEVSGRDAAAPGGRGPGHVHHRHAAGGRGRPHPQHHPVRRAHLRAHRPHADEGGPAGRRGHPAQERGGHPAPGPEAGRRRHRRPPPRPAACPRRPPVRKAAERTPRTARGVHYILFKCVDRSAIRGRCSPPHTPRPLLSMTISLHVHSSQRT